MRRRFELGLVVATIAHVAIVASMRAPARAPVAKMPTASELPIDVTLDEPPASPPPPPPAAEVIARATVPGISSSRSSPTTPAEPRASANEEPSTPSPSAPSEPVVTAPVGSAPSTWSYVFKNGAPPPSVVGTSSLYATAPPKDDPVADANPTATMRGMMHQRDVELGLAAGGPMVGPAEQSTRLSRAPVNGFSVVVATFGPDGVVMDVHVVDDNGDREAWDEVAKDIAETMRSKHVRVPKGAHGVEVTMRIDSRWQLPDGSDPDPYKVCVLGLPCDAGPHRRVVTVGPNLISGPIPTSGGGPLRVVHARVVDEHLM